MFSVIPRRLQKQVEVHTPAQQLAHGCTSTGQSCAKGFQEALLFHKNAFSTQKVAPTPGRDELWMLHCPVTSGSVGLKHKAQITVWLLLTIISRSQATRWTRYLSSVTTAQALARWDFPETRAPWLSSQPSLGNFDMM